MPQPLQGAEHVLDQDDLGVARLDRRGPHQVGDLVDARLDLGLTGDVHTLENDAVAGGRGLHRQRDRLAGVKRVAAERDLTQDGPLLHGFGAVSEGGPKGQARRCTKAAVAPLSARDRRPRSPA